MTGLSELQIVYIVAAGIVAIFVIIVVLANSVYSESNTVAGTDTQDESIELAKITVYSPDGKELKTYMAKADSVDTYSEGEADFETQEGNRVILLAGNNLIEVSYL